MKIEVGKFYMSANDEVIKIDGKSKAPNGEEYFIGSNGTYYYQDDLRTNKHRKSKYDLIAEIPKELHQHLIKEVMNYWQDEDFRNTVNNVYGVEK